MGGGRGRGGGRGGREALGILLALLRLRLDLLPRPVVWEEHEGAHLGEGGCGGEPVRVPEGGLVVVLREKGMAGRWAGSDGSVVVERGAGVPLLAGRGRPERGWREHGDWTSVPPSGVLLKVDSGSAKCRPGPQSLRPSNQLYAQAPTEAKYAALPALP